MGVYIGAVASSIGGTLAAAYSVQGLAASKQPLWNIVAAVGLILGVAHVFLETSAFDFDQQELLADIASDISTAAGSEAMVAQ
ncbi:hypothetical protein [Paraburkholderia xenovorans]|uniref:hypothetical protein n=1 Tax=Paraburkholderia xenovorans TaxID=36873 RepID=UPI0038B7C31D